MPRCRLRGLSSQLNRAAIARYAARSLWSTARPRLRQRYDLRGLFPARCEQRRRGAPGARRVPEDPLPGRVDDRLGKRTRARRIRDSVVTTVQTGRDLTWANFSFVRKK